MDNFNGVVKVVFFIIYSTDLKPYVYVKFSIITLMSTLICLKCNNATLS